MTQRPPIPVIDLFAGPGGLGEGFASLSDPDGTRRFEVKVSAEKDEIAHRILYLRALFRSFPEGKAPDCYYDYVRGNITREQLFAHREAAEAGREALTEARCAELGKTSHQTIDGWILRAVGDANQWALIVRRDGETLNTLIKRLDKAIGLYYDCGKTTDEINPPSD